MSSYLGTLFAKPHKWAALHRDLLRVKEDQVSSERLVGSTYLPQDGDQEFEAIAADFAKPTREDFLDGTILFNCRESHFWSVFDMLRPMMRLEEEAEGDQPDSQYFRMSKYTMGYLINVLLAQVHLNTGFVLLRDSKISFHIHSCGVKGTLKPAGVLSRCSDLRNKITLPLATFSAMCPQKNKDTICHEIPQILIQAVLMFQQNPTLKTYRPFALRVDGTKIQLSSAPIPQTYIQDLSRGSPLTGELTILHSVAYDLRNPEERREISRLLNPFRHPAESRSNGSLVDLPSAPSDLTAKDLYVSGSRWGQIHLKALRVQLIEPVSPERVFPCEFLPASDDPVFTELGTEIMKASEDTLKDWYLVASDFAHNRFVGLFADLATLMTTRPAHVEGTIAHERDPSPESDLSTESNEDQDEELSRLVFSDLLRKYLF
ncbi:hypothetical protein DTO166G4_6436 [Paecilomyces variotii]|nr:hypothetical protein DTO166G4_6436 [Paecilomyces variotii]KAJ9231999.1 hypothetical protein DTO166G5_6530 [Paecilomyces variotii]KAJ9261906.1 hypothetical protein DTO195F2_3894 [Paecilomyces variotii]KAJ9398866.1 hypothetical protein DTO282F9_4218 [Paecilomyces variotii]